MREVLKAAHLFGEASGHAGMARDAFVDVIAEAVVKATNRSAAPSPPAGPTHTHLDHDHHQGDTTLPREGIAAAAVDGHARISSAFGARTDPITGKHSTHHGVDIAAAAGTAITSISAGTVVKAGAAGGYGNVVEVQGADGTITRYAHAERIDVRVGERVEVGDALATVGSTGRSTGPHLHLEVRKGGVAVDPTTALLAQGRGR